MRFMVKPNNIRRCLLVLLVNVVVWKLYFDRPAAPLRLNGQLDTILKGNNHLENQNVIQQPIQSSPQHNADDSIINNSPLNNPDTSDSKLLSMSFLMMSLKEQKEYVHQKNNLQTILNSHLLPNPRDNGKFDMVIIIQSHKRHQYLETLLTSIQKARGTSKVLLIVSHDYLLDEMRDVVEKVKFCPVMQIFFPYSTQLHPDVFPGTDPRDCKRDTPKQLARAKGCLNAESPDQYGHYREADYTMTKHHWWWKINFIFDRVSILKGYQGLVLLLEEDYYVAPDFLTILKMLNEKRQSEYTTCDFVGLGSYNRHGSYSQLKDKADYVAWASDKNNMGMALDRATFNKIKRCNNHFCKFDDYNWDWTIQSLGRSCFGKPLTILTMMAPHVFHVGDCAGLHHKGSCKMEDTVTSIERALSANMDYLFPKEIKVTSPNKEIRRYPGVLRPNGFGGWGDNRDHKLCMSYIDVEKYEP